MRSVPHPAPRTFEMQDASATIRGTPAAPPPKRAATPAFRTGTRRGGGRRGWVIALAAAALTGCSAAVPVQSTPAACAVLEKSLNAVSSSAYTSLSDPSADPQAAATSMKQISMALGTGLAKVTNPEIKNVGKKTQAALKRFIADITSALGTPSQADEVALTADSKTVSADLTAFGTACS